MFIIYFLTFRNIFQENSGVLIVVISEWQACFYLIFLFNLSSTLHAH